MSGEPISTKEFREAAVKLGKDPHDLTADCEDKIVREIVVGGLNVVLGEVKMRNLDLEEAAITIVINGVVGLRRLGWDLNDILDFIETEIAYHESTEEEF